MRKTLVTLVVLVLLGGPVPLRAQEATHCTFEFEVVLSPGLSMTTPSSGTHRSSDPGPLQCEGLVNGKQPIGSGTLGVEGRIGTKDGATCMGGEGDGVDTLRIPTAAGFETVLSEFTFTFGGKVPTHGGLAAGEFEGNRFTGTFEFTPTEGDCVTAPVTKAHVSGEGVIHR
jgi:hypothetical protein